MRAKDVTTVGRSKSTGDLRIEYLAENGTTQELIIPRALVHKLAWVPWLEPTSASRQPRQSLPIPVVSIGTATTEQHFVLLLRVAAEWELPLQISKDHLPGMRTILQQMELHFSDPTRV